jgi:hypothetical protein
MPIQQWKNTPLREYPMVSTCPGGVERVEEKQPAEQYLEQNT